MLPSRVTVFDTFEDLCTELKNPTGKPITYCEQNFDLIKTKEQFRALQNLNEQLSLNMAWRCQRINNMILEGVDTCEFKNFMDLYNQSAQQAGLANLVKHSEQNFSLIETEQQLIDLLTVNPLFVLSAIKSCPRIKEMLSREQFVCRSFDTLRVAVFFKTSATPSSLMGKMVNTLDELTELVVIEPKFVYDHIIRQPGFLARLVEEERAAILLDKLNAKPETLANYVEIISEVMMPGIDIRQKIITFFENNPGVVRKIDDSLTLDNFMRLAVTNNTLAHIIITNAHSRALIASGIRNEADRVRFIDFLIQEFPKMLNSIPVNEVYTQHPFDNPKNTMQIVRRLQLPEGKEEKFSPAIPFKNLVFFCRVFSDGVGDLIHCITIAKLWQKCFPDLNIQVVALADDYQARSNKISVLIKKLASTIPCGVYPSGLEKNKMNVRWKTISFDHLISQFVDAEGVFEVSCRTSGLKEELAQRGIYPKYFAFWAEASIKTIAVVKEFALVPSLEMLFSSNLRIGVELGIHFNDSLAELKSNLASLSFQEKVQQLENVELKEILLAPTPKLNRFLYMGYLRNTCNLVNYCLLIGKMHQHQSDAVYVYVKEPLSAAQLHSLRQYGIFSDITVMNNGILVSTITTITNENSPPRPSLCLICMPVDFSDSNLMIAMSPMIAAGGDISYFQALSLPTLPFFEKMNHDDIFYRFLIYLIDHYLPDSDLSNYFRKTFTLTALSSLYPEFATIVMPQIERLYTETLDGNLAKLTAQYAKFITLLKANHNIENTIRNFGRWYQENVWQMEPERAVQYTTSFVSFWRKRTVDTIVASAPELATVAPLIEEYVNSPAIRVNLGPNLP